MLPVQLFQIFFRQFFLIFHLFDHYSISEHFHRIILFLPFLAENQERLSVNLKIILLQRKLQKLGFSAVQKSCHQIYHYIWFHFSISPVFSHPLWGA